MNGHDDSGTVRRRPARPGRAGAEAGAVRDVLGAVRAPDRLAAVRRTGLLDTPAEEAFDRLTRLATMILGTPVALVALVDRDRQVFKSCIGLPEPWASRRETPLSHSICQYEVASGEPLVINDARQHPLVCESPAIRDLGVVAYLGIPLVTADGHVLGSFCVIDVKPRRWSRRDVDLLRDLAASVMTEIGLQAAILDTEREWREKVVLLDSVAEGIFGLDHEGRCTFLNRAGAVLVGYRPDEVIGRNMHQLIHHSRTDGSPYPAEACPIFRAFWAGEAAHADHEVLWRKDGTPVSVEYACRPLADDAGRRGAVVSFADIGERVGLERALRLSEARFRTMFEQSPASTQVFAPDGTSLYANPAWERLWGVEHARIAGYNVLRDPQLVDLGVAPYIERGFAGECLEVPAVMYQPERTIGGISRVSYRWVKALLYPVRDEAGAIREVVLMHEDVTDARRAEEERERLLAEARAAEARYRGLFAGVADAILVADADGRYLDANPATTGLLGYAREELLRLGVADVVAVGPAWTDAEYARFLQEGSWHGELELRRKDGEAVPVEAWATTIRLADGPVYVSAIRDISERRALERMQGEFIAMVTHELRTPVTVIKGYAQLMQRRGAGPETIKTIVAEADRLQRLLADLLDVSRLDAGRLELRRSVVDLAALARAAAEQAAALSPGHSVAVEVPEEAREGRWDPDRLGQVLQNLLTNAIKYSPSGGDVRVRVEDLGREARVSVSDQGIGVALDALPRLFERFYRTKAATASGATGLGVGLSIARSLVEAHGGRIWAESEGQGCGTAFRFTVPYEPPGHADQGPATAAVAE